ncbi:alanine/glycine:cation symporter family protein [Rhodospirillaceae bacterium SYSU D60014]|uniref:alanine/glycine:cation symporter family protein n=1 Tax=Virgifigura deserti TaxID=2268457 RepID=UPI000E66C834
METSFAESLSAISSFVWGPAMLVLLLGTGIYLTIGLGLLPQRRLGYGLRLLFAPADKTATGEIPPYQALMTALAATIGTGNIAGVATAIHLGGPGAVFWMWVTALVGMATKYAEAVLAVRFREQDDRGAYVGGPMYYIKNGLSRRWRWLGAVFALFAAIAGFGIGNTVQANSVAESLQSSFGIPHMASGLVLAVLVFLVIIGGIKRIGEVAGRLVPFMAVVYTLGALVIVVLQIDEVPAVLGMIVRDAFTGTAAAGGFAGAGFLMALRFGVARGVFSNEAGLGSAPIAHAAARTNDPVRQGVIAMLSPFFDTLIVCTMTALVILTTGAWTSGETGADLSGLAFATGLPGPGNLIVTFGLVLFAFTTILGWSYYGERSAEYLLGTRVILPFRLVWVAAVFVGAVANLGVVWLVADIMNALMAVPNLVALLLLSPVVFQLSRAHFQQRDLHNRR